MYKTLFFLFFIFTVSTAQTITGIVSDNANKPLESANVIAVPADSKATLKFAIADNKGRYRLELDKGFAYTITVSYIGYIEEVLIIEANSTLETYNFKLVPTGDVLKEIVIKHEYKPIIIKKDTLIYDVKAFTNGNERKLKEQLEKLPGVAVDKNGGVTVQGKKVTKFLVEGDSFFGGGTKLGVENIPANAVDKVEVIDHFSEVGFLKKVSDSDDLAMNIKLKADKKKFVFGDVEAATEVANDNGFHLAHAALFYYTPKANISFIGDVNNIGKSTFTFQDLMQFDGGVSRFISGRTGLTDLFMFTADNRDVIQNKSQFSALNFKVDAGKKLDISGFSIFSKIFTASQNNAQISYLQNEAATFENRLQHESNNTTLGIGNLKLDYSPNNKEKWYYNGQYQSSTNDISTVINSITNNNTAVFETISNADNNSVKQYLEWHKSFNNNHTTTFVVNQSFEANKPQNQWFSNQSFLPSLIPLQIDENYTINQITKLQNNSIDVLLKHYWIINNFNHLYTNIGFNHGSSRFTSAERQLLTSGATNDFATAGFGNNTNYRLNDAYFGLEYKFKVGKWTGRPGIYLHQYDLKVNQNNTENTISKAIFQPQFNGEYEFNKSENLNISYRLAANFPDVTRMANKFILQNYNTVFRGNSLLSNEQYHAASLRYSKMNLYRGLTLYSSLNFNKRLNTIRNQVQLVGINQFNTPILTDNPETNWRFMSEVSKQIYRFKLELNSSLSWFNYVQTLNNITTSNNRNNQNIGVALKTAYNKWPDFSIRYTKGFSQFRGITQANFQSDELASDVEINFLKNFVFKFEYENVKNTDNNNQSNFFAVANSAIRYQKKNAPLGFELFANNLFNSTSRNDYSFSDFIISERQIFILPRVLMFSVSYKL